MKNFVLIPPPQRSKRPLRFGVLLFGFFGWALITYADLEWFNSWTLCALWGMACGNFLARQEILSRQYPTRLQYYWMYQ